MLTGPQNMPVFGDNQLTPRAEARDHHLHHSQLQQDKDPGGCSTSAGSARCTEGLAIFVVGIIILVFATLWIAGKS